MMSDMLQIALPKGRLGEKVYKMFAEAGYECPEALEDTRKLIFENKEAGVCYFWVKPSDVAIYVERGAADIGVAGKDILLEYSPDIYELADFNIGKCKMAVAAKKDFRDNTQRALKVATKFPNIAKAHYASKGRDIDIIKLNGSIEIAPGVYAGQQNRKGFGFSYRTLIGNDSDGTDYGYKIHIVYGAKAKPSGRDNATVNDSPEAITLSWECSTTPVDVPGGKPTAHLVIDSTKTDAGKLASLEKLLYGSETADPKFPTIAEVIELMKDAAAG